MAKPFADGHGPCHETPLCPVADDGKALVTSERTRSDADLLHRLRRPVGLLPEYANAYRPQPH